MLPQEEALAILAEFLHEHGCEKVEKISIDTIVQLARLVLQENVFVYDKKYYRQVIGGAMGSPFTLTLANIFMWKWEKQAVLSKLSSGEVFGR
jgi:anti-sigma factor ChrR (cupin superfamily)